MGSTSALYLHDVLGKAILDPALLPDQAYEVTHALTHIHTHTDTHARTHTRTHKRARA